MKHDAATSSMDLEGRAALVTGAGKRVGAAVAKALSAAGADVALHYRSSAREAARVAKALATKSVPVQGDLAKAEDRRRLLEEASEGLGRPVDLLVNNASIFPPMRLGKLSLEHLHENVTVNAWAPFELTRAMAKRLPEGGDGVAVNFLDARIVDDDLAHAGYFLSKRLLADFTRLCSLELAPRVRVNAVAPGPVLPPPGTPKSEQAGHMERLRRLLPLQRNPTPEDLAQAVVFLAAARSVTGQVVFVDGGRHLGRRGES
jgi:pteridine reductase